MDGRVQQQLELRERSLWEMREGDLRQRGQRGPPRFEKGAERREGRGGMSKQYYSKGAKKRENVLPASRLVTRSFILHPPPIPISISSPLLSAHPTTEPAAAPD